MATLFFSSRSVRNLGDRRPEIAARDTTARASRGGEPHPAAAAAASSPASTDAADRYRIT